MLKLIKCNASQTIVLCYVFAYLKNLEGKKNYYCRITETRRILRQEESLSANSTILNKIFILTDKKMQNLKELNDATLNNRELNNADSL